MTKKKRPASEIPGITQLNGLQYFVTEMARPTTVTSKGGIVLAQTEKSAEEWARYGRIVVDGDGAVLADGKHHECKYAVGDHVLLDRYTAQTVVRGKHVRLVPEPHIFAKVDPDAMEADNADDWRPGS
jgi:co-chaperonin GroES (HSP10)|tara:strand:- start:183 stop:566 length:384 start_codon:yes stop_codon:yes gene_type:complete